MSDKATLEDIQDAWNNLPNYADLVKQYAELEKYASGDEEGEYVWIIPSPFWHTWDRMLKKMVKRKCRGATYRHKRSRKARSRHFVYRYSTENNGNYSLNE